MSENDQDVISSSEFTEFFLLEFLLLGLFVMMNWLFLDLTLSLLKSLELLQNLIAVLLDLVLLLFNGLEVGLEVLNLLLEGDSSLGGVIESLLDQIEILLELPILFGQLLDL